MKKGVKLSAATVLAISALTPAAVFAAEEQSVADGFYVDGEFLPLSEFQQLSKKDKKQFLINNIANNAIVLVQKGKVFDLTNAEIQNAPAESVDDLGVDVSVYEQETGNKLDPSKGLVSDDVEAELKVESVSAINATTLQAKLKVAKTGLVTDDFTVAVDGVEVEIISVVSDPTGETYTISIPSLDGKTGTVSVNGTESSYDFTAPKVESITTINANEIKVTFNQEVTSETANEIANYDVELNKTSISSTKLRAALQADGKTVIIRYLQDEGSFTIGDRIVVQVKDGIKGTKGQSVERFTTDTIIYSLDDAPQLVGKPKFKPSSTTGKLIFTFDRPIKNTSTTLVKIDGVALADVTFEQTAIDKLIPGNYVYEVDIAAGTEFNTAKELGKHEVVVFDVAETARENAAVTSVFNTEYTVVADTTAPAVVGLTALNANKFFIEFTEDVTLDADLAKSIKVSKGTLEFPTLNASTVNDTDATANTYVELGYLLKDGKLVPGAYVVVDDTTSGAENPLYKDGENSVTLNVVVQNYKDGADLLGTKYEGTITLAKGVATPEVVKTVVNDTKDLEILFDGTLNSAPNKSNLIVRDKDGIIIPDEKVDGVSLVNNIHGDVNTYTERVVKISLDADYQDRAPYSVTFKKDAVEYAKNNTSITGYSIEGNKNKELTTTVGTASDSSAKYFAYSGTPSAGSDNVITINYGVDMDNSARQVSNYLLDGKPLPAGTKVDFYENKKTVKITLPKETVKTTTDYKLTVKTDVKTADNQSVVASLQSLTPFEYTIKLTDNTRPVLVSGEYLVGSTNDTTSNQIIVKFSEAIASNLGETFAGTDFKVVVNGNTIGVERIANGDVNDEYAIIVLDTSVAISQAATITVKEDVVEKENSVIEDTNSLKLNASTITVVDKTLDSRGNAYSAPAPAAPDALGADSVSNVGETDGAITGLVPETKYELKNVEDGDYIEVETDGDGKITGLAAGKYVVRIPADPLTGAPASEDSAEVVVQNPAPAAPNSLSGDSKKITGLDSEKLYQYSTDGENWTDVEPNSTEITGLDAGTYQVRIAPSADGLTPASEAQTGIIVTE